MRGEIKINNFHLTLIDDYAHHPTEIKATFEAIRSGWPARRLIVIYQPHRFTRMRDLFEDFSEILSQPDRLIVFDVYPAGEKPIPGSDGRSFCRAIISRGIVDPTSKTAPVIQPKAGGDIHANLKDPAGILAIKFMKTYFFISYSCKER